MSYFSNVGFNNPFIDNAGRLRVSQILSLGDYKILNADTNALLMDYTGSAGSVATVSTNKINMAVVSGSYYIGQTKVYHPYLNAKSQFITMTTANFGTANNVEKSIGYYSSDATGSYSSGLDGFRLIKDTSNVVNFQVWRSGSLIHSAPQSSWTDPLNGTGASGMNLSIGSTWNNFNIFAFDFLYLGGSCINCYTYYQGAFRQFYTYYHASTDLSPMFNSPNKPLRWEIRGISGSGNMDLICGEVATEGTLGEMANYGNSISVDSPIAGFSLASAGTSYALCGVRKKATSRDIYAFVDTFEAMVGTSDYIRVSVILNPTVAGSFTYSDVPNTPFQTAIGGATNTVTGGTVLATTMASQNMNNSKKLVSALGRLGATLNNTMDSIVLVVTPAFTSTNTKALGSLDVKWFI